jgi:DNA (cytosine-5)-methyltransferase 1
MKIISLFSGAGGLDLGLFQAGHKIIWANDNDEDAVATYKNNIGNHIVHKDIEDISSNEIPWGDVVVGGFPCQGFSQANLRRSSLDERNKLYIHFLRVITDKKPYYFLAENVRGILSLDKGAAINKILSDFEEAGYRVKHALFNTANYGVPQARWRVIIAGTRQDLPIHFDYIFPQPTHTKRPPNNLLNGFLEWVTIEEALKDIPEPSDKSETLPNHIYSKYKITNRNFTGHRRTNPKMPSPTILARGNGKGGVCALQHPLNHRRLSVRESAIIQTFPLDYEFVGSMNNCYRQVGNAVPVLFGYHLGKQLSILEGKCKICA